MILAEIALKKRAVVSSDSCLAVEIAATIAKSTFVDWTGERAPARHRWSAQADLARVAAT